MAGQLPAVGPRTRSLQLFRRLLNIAGLELEHSSTAGGTAPNVHAEDLMQIVFHRSLSLSVIWIGIAAALAGCGRAETPPVAPVKSTLPQSGSTFRFDRRDLDSAGATIPGSEGEAAITFLKTDLTFRNRDSVIAAADKNSTEVGYFRYEGTDGISIFTKRIEDYGIPGVWVTLPINGGPPVQTSHDTTMSLLGTTVPITVAATATAHGSEKFDMRIERLDVQKVEIQVVVRRKSDGIELLRHTHTVWYAQKIGYFAMEDIVMIAAPSLGFGGPARIHTIRELTSYEVA
jgi:hypothetical protein